MTAFNVTKLLTVGDESERRAGPNPISTARLRPNRPALFADP